MIFPAVYSKPEVNLVMQTIKTSKNNSIQTMKHNCKICSIVYICWSNVTVA